METVCIKSPKTFIGDGTGKTGGEKEIQNKRKNKDALPDNTFVMMTFSLPVCDWL